MISIRMVSPLLSSRLFNPRQVSAAAVSPVRGPVGWAGPTAPHKKGHSMKFMLMVIWVLMELCDGVIVGTWRYVRLSDVPFILIHRGVVGEFNYPPAAACSTHWAGMGWETLNKDPIRIFSLTAASTSSIAIHPILHSTGQASLISYRCLTFSSQNFCRLQLSSD